MSDVFISYRRKPSASLANLIQRELQSRHHLDAYLDTTRTDSTRVQFPERLMTAIEDAPTFVCLLSDSTLDSEWVRKEIWKAYELKKHCIPVFQEAYEPPTDSDEAIDYLLNFDGVHILDVKNLYIDQAISDIAALVVRKPKQRRISLVMGLVVMLLVIGGVVGAVLLSNRGGNGVGEITDTPETEIASAPTATNTPTNTPEPPTPTLQPGFERLTSNAEWTSQYPNGLVQEIDGVAMVLVPAGCFMMGSESGDDNETPVHEQCFEEPFWIDRTEVTNAQYGSVGCSQYSSEPDQPRNCITWFDARDYCESRGARLPTEAEWEYAARGPDSLTYPWGDTYDTALVIGADDPTYGTKKTAPVGSRPSGASWVGAMDMSGNVWEWTRSVYNPYPYNRDDGREVDQGSSADVLYVLRGGSFSGSSLVLRAAFRFRDDPLGEGSGFGIRCARSS